jgi:dienelactone hydrolase
MMGRLTLHLVGALAAAIAIPSSRASAQTMTMQLYPLQTATVSSEQFLTDSKDGKPVVIAGELRIPVTAAERVPAVVIVHGGVGVGDHEDNWAREFNKLGVAAFILDSFTGRSIADTRANLTQLSSLATLGDSYRALELLSKHPRIDPSKIAIIGFSRGALAALYASSRRFQALHGPKGVEFAAYIAFYTPCGTTYIDDENVSDKPIRLFHGTADDLVSVEACRQYVGRLQKAGKDVTLTEYPDSYHRFDDLGLQTKIFLPQGQTFRNCVLTEGPAGILVNQKTGLPFTSADFCLERGVTAALNVSAQIDSMRAVKALLAQTFSLN